MFSLVFRITLLISLQFGFYFNANFRTIASGNLSQDVGVDDSFSTDNHILSPQDVIFEVRHSKSPNVVVYQANKTISKLLNPEKPLEVYWLMNTKGKKTEALTTLEWKLAFGYKLMSLVKGKKYKISLNAIKDKEIVISLDENGKAEAFMQINRNYSKLNGVYIDFEYSFYLPKVKYVEFTGNSTSTGKKCTERIYAQS